MRPFIAVDVGSLSNTCSLLWQLLKFFDKAGRGDDKVTLEEMISGFRKIRREWATVKAERAGRVVLAKVVRLMRRAGMSLEEWFKFMDISQVMVWFSAEVVDWTSLFVANCVGG